MSRLSLLRAVYARLRTVVTDDDNETITDDTDVDVTPYDAPTEDGVSYVVQVADGQAGYPIVEFAIVSHVPFDSKTSFGFRAIVRVGVHSRSGGYDEILQQQDIIHELLHRQPLVIDGREAVLCQAQQATLMDDPDGETRHGIQEFAVIYETGDLS